MERERTRGPPATAPVAADPTRLYRLIDAALKAEGMDRFVAAGKLNDLLIAMRAPGDEAAEAEAILAALDVSSLDGLVDGYGRNCRKEAVETLLACGFPHALQVSPEDLAHARRRPPRPRLAEPGSLAKVPNFASAKWWAYGAAAAQLVGALATLPQPILPTAVAVLGAGALGLAGQMFGATRAWSGVWIPLVTMLTGATLGGLAAAAMHNPWPAAGAAIAGTYVLSMYDQYKADQ